MWKKLATVTALATALSGVLVAVPTAASAYDTTACNDGIGPEVPITVGSPPIVFVGVEPGTPTTSRPVGAWLCFEVNHPSGGNLVGQTIGIGIRRVDPSSPASNGVVLEVDQCGLFAEYNCGTVGATGIELGEVGVDLTGDMVGAGVRYTCLWVTGANTVTACHDTTIGVGVNPVDLAVPGVTASCLVTVGTLCVGAPRVVIGSSGEPTILVIVNGIPVPVNVTYACITVPIVPCTP